MSDKIRRVTPREIADMLINEQAYQSTLFVKAEDHDAEIANLDAEIVNLRTEVLEQSRLLGMGSEKEAKLRARVEVLEREMRYIGRLDYPPTRMSAQNRARAALEDRPCPR